MGLATSPGKLIWYPSREGACPVTVEISSSPGEPLKGSDVKANCGTIFSVDASNPMSDTEHLAVMLPLGTES